MEAEAPASAGSFREESAALGVGMGGGGAGALDGEGGARAGKRGWSMTRHWRLNRFCAFTVSALWCLSHGSGGLKSCLAAQRARVVSNGPQNPSPPVLLRQEMLL